MQLLFREGVLSTAGGPRLFAGREKYLISLILNRKLMADYIYLDSDASTPHTTNFNVFASVMLVIYFAASLRLLGITGKINYFIRMKG